MSAGIDGFNPSFLVVGGGVTGSRYSCSKRGGFAMNEVQSLLELALLLIQIPTAMIALIVAWQKLKKEKTPSCRRRPHQ
jgi:hypothetical protein